METAASEVRVGYTDRRINALIEGLAGQGAACTRHFSQGEEFFLLLPREYTVPSFPIHHDVRLLEPSEQYITGVRAVIEEVAAVVPGVLRELTYFFDPADILRPCFFKVFRVEESFYLYLLRVDLRQKPMETTLIQRGTNDTTPCFRTPKLYLDPLIIPLDDVVRENGKVSSFRIRQVISQTWIGEQGRGYFVQGIWMDADLTRFFSRLFMARGQNTYPFYPYLCRYKTVCQSILDLSPEARKTTIPHLHRALQFLAPAMERIQAEMKGSKFSEDLECYKELKGRVPSSWYEPWSRIRVEAYLNAAERREFRVEI